jgi:nucleotide-binding universal stress UspA family protein
MKTDEFEPMEVDTGLHRTTRAAEAASDLNEMLPLTLKLRNILVPLDFSEPAEKALRYAVAFGGRFEARITLLHVRELPYYLAEPGFVPAVTPIDDPSEAVTRRLEADVRRLVPPEMHERTLLRVGAPFDEICKAAAELNTDLIILSTHGYTGLKHALMGSTAERVVRHAPCPVLVVRKRQHELPDHRGRCAILAKQMATGA